MPWRDISDDPNSVDVMRVRQQILSEATGRPLTDRSPYVVELCRGRDVVDIGCVDHRAVKQNGPRWLHRHIATVAARCVGVDIEPEGVADMVANGFEAMVHDICSDPGPLIEIGPFDVVVAGEVIEHLGAPQALFEFAAAVLRPGGILVITTPNPYNLSRVFAGLRGEVWENADHTTYAFPAGIIELGERAGLHLVDYRTVIVTRVGRQVRRQVLGAAGRLKRRLAGPRRSAGSPERQTRTMSRIRNPIELVVALFARSSASVGMVSVYVLRRSDTR